MSLAAAPPGDVSGEALVNVASLDELRSRTIWRSFSAIADRHADKDAFVAASDDGVVQRSTYRQLAERARNLAAGLAGIGVRRGDHVALWMTNSPEWIVTWFAVMRLGAVLVPLNTFYRPPEIAYVLGHARARHLIMLDGFRTLNMPGMLGDIAPAFREARTPGFLCSAELPDLRNVIMRHRRSARASGVFDYADLEDIGAATAAMRETADAMETAVRGDDLGVIKYTSGSTGFPKGAMLKQGGIVANATLHAARAGITGADTFFSQMPFFHGGGSIWGLMTMMMHGGTLVFTEAFNPKLAATLLDTERASVMFGVLGNEVIEEAISAGRTFPALWNAPIARADARGTMLNVRFTIRPFGLTEAYGPAAVGGVDDPVEKQGTCGRMLDGNVCRVVDPDTGLDVAPGEPGEARLKGNVTEGYWGDAEQTALAFDGEGWFRSGDLVSQDADGYITYLGRPKLMIKVGGENVSLEEVESVVRSHPDVASCGALGVPDDRKREVARAYVVRREGSTLDDAMLRRWLGPRMARFKLPRDLMIVDALPWLANGKLDRVTLGEWARADG